MAKSVAGGQMRRTLLSPLGHKACSRSVRLMTFEHDGLSITIELNQPTTEVWRAVVLVRGANRAMAAIGCWPLDCAAQALGRLSAVLRDRGRRPLSVEKEARVMARIVGRRLLPAAWTYRPTSLG